MKCEMNTFLKFLKKSHSTKKNQRDISGLIHLFANKKLQVVVKSNGVKTKRNEIGETFMKPVSSLVLQTE